MALFNFGYSFGAWNPHRDNYFAGLNITDRGYASLQNQQPYFVTPGTKNSNFFVVPDRDREDEREYERDMSDWLDPYNEPEQGEPPEYPFHEFNYGP